MRGDLADSTQAWLSVYASRNSRRFSGVKMRFKVLYGKGDLLFPVFDGTHFL